MGRELAQNDREYNRRNAVAYARKWALKRNPRYYNFSGLGGDCANFASQCLFAGAEVMNYKPLYGWYYSSSDNRTPSWSGVKYLYNFLVGNQGAGPWAEEVELAQVQPGDIIQISTYLPEYHHTLVVVDTGEAPGHENTLICSHSYDSLDRVLATYEIQMMRCLHIVGVGG